MIDEMWVKICIMIGSCHFVKCKHDNDGKIRIKDVIE